MTFHTNRISMVGLGLIGGSIARAIKHFHPEIQILGTAGHEETILEAYEAGVIENQSFLSPQELAAADILFLCGPVGINTDYLRKLHPYIQKDTLLTDVGSVKGDIHAVIRDLGLDGQFIGGHPMTGSEKIGFANSNISYLENAYYILTAETPQARELLPDFAAFISSLGAITLTMEPEKHDLATAAISHVPHIISASLVNLVCDQDSEDEVMKTIAAGGFRDITRISSSSPQMWQHICLSNREAILQLLDTYQEELARFRAGVEAADADALLGLFGKAKNFRDSLPLRKKGGVLPAAFEFYVNLADEAGQIATIASILAANALSIKNIGILHNREFEQGVLQVEMYDEPSMEEAIRLLKKRQYDVIQK